MFNRDAVVLPATASSAIQCPSLTQVPLQYRVAEYVITLQYTYPKYFTHQFAVSQRKTTMQELRQKSVVLTL
jgi:hypothetical protein